MTTEQIEKSISEIYIATYGRAADKEGLDYWVNEYSNSNMNLDDISKNFYYEQAEASTIFENMTNEEFINTIYQNVLSRDADSDGQNYWLSEFEEGTLSKDVFIKTLIDGAKAETGNSNDALLLDNKVNAALYYTNNVQVDSPLASELMLTVTSDTQSVNDVVGTVEYYDNWINEYINASNNTLDSQELWSQLNDDNYWQNLSSNMTVDVSNGVSFWEYDDDFWEHGHHENDFDFLDDSSIWFNQSSYDQMISGTLYEDYLNNLDITLENIQTDIINGETVDITELQNIEQSYEQVEDYYEYNYGLDIEDYYESVYGFEPDDILENYYGYDDDLYENQYHSDNDDYYEQIEDYIEYTYGYDIDINNSTQLQQYMDLINSTLA